MLETATTGVALGTWSSPTATIAVVIIAAASAQLVRLVLRQSLRAVADRRLTGRRAVVRWRTRLPRSATEPATLGELRRRQRIDAAALALSRIATMAIWITAAVWTLHLHDIAVGVALSGAGFLGLVVAFSAQHSLNDYVTGLHILLEDRYGEGDDIEVIAPDGHRVRGIVIALGTFTTRLQSDEAIHHLANRMMGEVANHSQLGVLSTIEIDEVAHVVAPIADAAAASALRNRPGMPAVVVENVGSLDDSPSSPAQLTVRSSRALGDTDRHVLGRELRQLLDDQG